MGPIPQCPFAAMFEEMKRARENEEALNANNHPKIDNNIAKKSTKKSISKKDDDHETRDFLKTQLERDRFIEQRLMNFTKPEDDLFLIKQLEQVELSKEERDRELAQRRAQLEAIFSLVKKQEHERAGTGTGTGAGAAENNATSSATTNTGTFEFNVLKEDGTYEKKEVELKQDFESQMRLYGL